MLHRSHSLDHFDLLEDIKSEIRSAQNNENRCKIVAWLSKSVPDPSIEHNLAQEKHEATTDSWLIDGDDMGV